jgi:transglutaminase-like putative cysteine protease
MTGSARLALTGGLATVLAAAGLQPLIDGGGWTRPALVAVALVVGSGIAMRALRAPGWAVVATQGLALVLWAGTLVAADVARLGWLPSRAWAERLGEVATFGVDAIQSSLAPVPLNEGILLLTVLGVGATAWAVDALAVTARRALLAGIPLALVHGVAMGANPVGPPAWAFVATAGGYLALLVVDSRERSARWGRPLGAPVSTSESLGSRATSLAAVGWPLGLGALLVAVVGAGLLPQGGLALLNGPGDGGSGGQTIRTENPIVDLKRDLVRPDNVDVLRLATSEPLPEYLRLVALDVFDGQVWRTDDRPVPDDQRVSDGLPSPPGLSPQVPRSQTQYQIEITDALASEWLPLPYPAQEVATSAGDWRYDAQTLDVVATDRTTQGLRYDVTALSVQPSAEQLAGLPPLPGRLLDLLELPPDLPPLVRDLAREVTADATDNYERAVALQQWFRQEGGFVYDLSTDAGNGNNDLVAFLEERRGYCEQYAATMAIMARVLGIPSRVAVGYLRGAEEQPGLWVVRAQDAHAWPELYFESVGWVRFEPTPGARTGSPPAYTLPGEGAGQLSDGLAGGESNPTADPGAGALAPLGEPGIGVPGAIARPSTWPLVTVGAVVLTLLLLPLLLGLVSRRRRWSRAADDPVLQAEAAWAQVRDSALEAGFRTQEDATIRVAAAALASTAALPPDDAARLRSVARATERARFAAVPPEPHGLRTDAEALREVFLGRSSRRTRVLAVLWPAPARRWWNRVTGR